jgi:HSP20 family protein
VDDWIQAEHELVWMPQSEFIENDREFRARLAVPGFDPTELDVTATPNELIVQAKHEHKHDESEGNVQYCEFGEKRLFRKLNMPAKIDQDRVTASLDKGILQIVAKKAQAAKSVRATA